MNSTGNKFLVIACCSLFIGLVGSWEYFLTNRIPNQPLNPDESSILITAIATVVVAAATILLAAVNYELHSINLETYKLIKRQVVPDLKIFNTKCSLRHNSNTQYLASVFFNVSNDSAARGDMIPPRLKLEGNDGREFETEFLDEPERIVINGGEIYEYDHKYAVDLTDIPLDNRYFSELKARLFYEDFTGMTRDYLVPTISFDPAMSELIRRYGKA